MIAIVYQSNTGHTEAYAQLLAEALDLRAYPLRESAKHLKAGDSIVYLGWVFAGSISGLKKASVLCAAAVGMNPPNAKNAEELKRANNLGSVPLFYLQGGVDYEKLRGIKKKMLQMVGKQVIAENRPEKQALIRVFQEGGNFVSRESLAPIIEFLASHK